MKIAILMPLPEELAILVAVLEKFGLHKRELQLEHLNVFEFKEVDLIVGCGGHGKTQFGIQAQYLLCQIPQIQLLACAGAAGALTDSLQVGDIVVATETVEHDYYLKFVSRPLPRFVGDSLIIESLRTIHTTEWDFAVHFGNVASGDEDIIDAVRGREIARLTNCIAVAWEGAGGARMCQFNKKRYVELRCVTDTANHHTAADFETNLASAMTNLTQFIIRWTESFKPSKATQN
jgi:adenosylhomocysteine nucleosidase